jgi:hypothetical protein
MRSMVRVRARPAKDLFSDAGDVFEDILVCETQHLPTFFAQECLASAIMHQLLDCPMCRAVNFNDKSPSDVNEVRNIGSDRVLPTKFETMHIGFAKSGPENHLRLGHELSKGPRAFSRLRFVVAHHSPHPEMLRISDLSRSRERLT